ncbi:unnamed protein product [Lathyrus sativus]|nr:unnamed protein product [Lathyrus sativus]
MNELKQVYLKAWAWLIRVPPKCWCKHAFSFYPKCDVLMNNIVESFNATILVARDKHIITMCEWIRKYLMNRRNTSAMELEKCQHKVTLILRKRLDNEVAMSGHWLPTWALDEKFQVTHSYNRQEFIVDIDKMSCKYNFWEKKYTLCYGFAVSPTNGQEMWPKVECEEIPPPRYKKGPGRPRKLRIRECGEEGARRRFSGVSYRCAKCDKFGHNVESCNSKKQDPNALKRKKKIKSDACTNPTAEVNANQPNQTTDVSQHDGSAQPNQPTEASRHNAITPDT